MRPLVWNGGGADRRHTGVLDRLAVLQGGSHSRRRHARRILLDRDVLDKARPDAADLRVYDAAGREVPYELAILRDIDSHSLFTSREVNRAVEGATAVISCDLGSQQPHNEVQVATSGTTSAALRR